MCVNQKLGSYLGTGRIITLAVYISAANIGIIATVAVCPHDNKPAVLQRCDLRIVLLVDDSRVDQELVDLGDRRRNQGRAILGGEDLGADIGTGATVMTTVILPGDDKAVAVRFNRRIRLGAAGPGIDLELVTNCAASRIVPLAKDTTAIPAPSSSQMITKLSRRQASRLRDLPGDLKYNYWRLERAGPRLIGPNDNIVGSVTGHCRDGHKQHRHRC